MRRHRARNLTVVAICAITAVAAPPRTARAELADTPWPMAGHDLRHTGRSTVSGPSTPHVRKRWSYLAPGLFYTSKESTPTIGPDGTVYIAVGQQPLCAVNPDGTQKWCTALGPTASGSAPTVGVDPLFGAGPGAVIYMGARDNKTWAVKDHGQNSYTILWRNKIMADGDVHSSPLIDPLTDTVYSSCGCATAGQLVALDPTPADMTDGPGEVLWPNARVRNMMTYTSPVLDDRPASPHYRRVYVITTDGKMHAFTADDAGRQWREEWPGGFLPAERANNAKSSPMIGDDGTIYTGTYIGVSAIVDQGSSAANKWSAAPVFLTSKAHVEGTPALSVNGTTVYVGTSMNPIRFYAIDAATGREKWHYPGVGDPPLSGPVKVSAAIGANGLIYMSAGTTLYALSDEGNHASLVWSFTAGGLVLGLSIGDGVLYATANDQYLYAIEDDPTAGP